MRELKPFISVEYREAIHAEIGRLEFIVSICDKYISSLNKRIRDPTKTAEEVAEALRFRERAFEMREDKRARLVAHLMQVQPTHKCSPVALAIAAAILAELDLKQFA
jgi:hypothetical protein